MCNSNTRSEYFLASCIYSCTQDTYYHWLCLSLQFRIVTTKGVREIIKSQNSFFVLYSLFPSPVVIVVWYIPDVCMCALGWGERKRKLSFGWNYYNQKVWREKWLFMLLCSPENRYVKSAFLGHLLALFPGTLSKLVYGFNVGRKSAGSLIPGLITTSTMQFVRCYFEY